VLKHDYVSGIFVDQGRFGEIPGALSTEDIGVGGGQAVTPHPDIVVNFASKVIPGCSLGPLESKPGAGGLKTILKIQVLGDQMYLDAAGFPGRTVGLDEK
jgi:hypothetical protein